MAIPLYRIGPQRNRIAFVGPKDPVGIQVFISRGFECWQIPLQEQPKPVDFWKVDSVIVSQNPAKPRDLVNFLEQYAHQLLAADCRIYLRFATKPRVITYLDARYLVIEAIDRLKLPTVGFSKEDRDKLGIWDMERHQPGRSPYVAFGEDSDSWDDLVRRVLSNPAGPPPRSAQELDIIDAKGDPKHHDLELEILLKRAFFDCRLVQLHEIGFGKSGPAAYRAFVTLAESNAGGSWPYQYFVKIGERPIIAKEFNNFSATVVEGIPYHLGPRLQEPRCVLGSQYGVMVCDYVSNAVTLGDWAKTGLGAVAINNLFMHTISAWRHGDSDEEYDFGNVLMELFPQRPPPDFRLKTIAALGHVVKHDGLQEKLSAYRSSPTLMGTIHGDMHAKNILVRNNEAILIDFEKLNERGPVLMDIASLEAGLLDDAFWGDGRSAKELIEFLRPLYCAQAFQRNRLKRQPTEVANWFYDDVRCIRMNAKTYERQKRQYAWMLATVMLTKACKDKNQDEAAERWGKRRDGLTPEDVRAVIYILGAELLCSLFYALPAQNGN